METWKSIIVNNTIKYNLCIDIPGQIFVYSVDSLSAHSVLGTVLGTEDTVMNQL